jgi:hypothetical protein
VPIEGINAAPHNLAVLPVIRPLGAGAEANGRKFGRRLAQGFN